jgi:hypothetical protein
LVFQGFGFPADPAIAKFTGSGKLDLYVGDDTGLGIYPGNGDGTFQTIANGDGTVSPPQQILLSVGTGSVAADLDNDGAPDIIAGDVVLLNRTGKLVSTPALDASKTALKASASTVATGASVTFTATVTSTAIATIPTGAVSFLDGTTALGTGALSSGAVATFSTTKLAAGSHSITAVYAGDGTFATSISTAITITVGGGSSGDFTLTATPTSATAAKGSSATTTISVAPTGGFNQQVSFACSGLPTGASYSFSPATVTPSGTAASTTTLTISTSAGSAIVSPTSDHRWPAAPSTIFTVLFSFIALSTLLAWLTSRTWKPEFRLGLLASVLLLAVTILGFAGCGGSSGSASIGSSGTPSGASTITITATAGSTSHTTTFTLTVQ